MEKLAEILQDLSLLCDKADLYYPTWDNRPKFLRELTETLKAATQEQDQIAHLKKIKNFLTGGQGSFRDISLSPPPASNLTIHEVN